MKKMPATVCRGWNRDVVVKRAFEPFAGCSRIPLVGGGNRRDGAALDLESQRGSKLCQAALIERFEKLRAPSQRNRAALHWLLQRAWRTK